VTTAMMDTLMQRVRRDTGATMADIRVNPRKYFRFSVS